MCIKPSFPEYERGVVGRNRDFYYTRVILGKDEIRAWPGQLSLAGSHRGRLPARVFFLLLLPQVLRGDVDGRRVVLASKLIGFEGGWFSQSLGGLG